MTRGMIGCWAVLLSVGLCGCGENLSRPTITVAVQQAGPRGAISGPLYHWQAEWEKESGARLRVVEIPLGEMHEQIFLDLETGGGLYDGIIGPAWFYGDYIMGDYVRPIDDYIARGSKGEFPNWDPDSVVPPLRQLHTWQNRWYGVPNDGDAHILYYRKDVLGNEDYQRMFESKHGKPMPVPPQTWEELAEVAEFFNGWDWNADGEPDHGISMHLAVGGQGFFHYMSLSAPYVVLPGDVTDRYHNIYWFDPETFEPLINSPGHVRALEMLRRLQQAGPAAQVEWQLKEAWDHFLAGKAIFCYSWGDVGSLAQDPLQSRIRGKLGCTALPGTREVYDRQSQQWVRFSEPNRVANTVGGSWHGVITRQTPHPDLVYRLFAFHAQRNVNMFNCAQGWTGVDPGRTFHFLPPNGDAKLSDYTEAGWHPEDVEQYVGAYYQNYYGAQATQHYLRIPGTFEMWRRLDAHLNEAVIDHSIPAQEVLDRVAADWKKFIERLEQRLGPGKLLELYRQSIDYQS